MPSKQSVATRKYEEKAGGFPKPINSEKKMQKNLKKRVTGWE